MNALNKDQLSELKKDLPAGWYKQVAKNVKCSYQTVYNVLDGTCKNSDIIERVIAETIKLKKAQSKKMQSISERIAKAIDPSNHKKITDKIFEK